MPLPPWKHIVLALVALGAAGISAVFILMLFPATVRTPADLLPAEHTIAYLPEPTASARSIVQSWFPHLPPLPETTQGEVLALLQENNMVEWAVFDVRSSPGNPQLIRTSSPQLVTFLAAPPTHPLSEDPDFQLLAPADNSTAAHFLRLSPTHAVLSPLSYWISLPKALSIEAEDQRIHISFGANLPAYSPLPSTHMLGQEQLLVQASALGPLALSVAEHIKPTVRDILGSFIATHLRTMVGSELSPTSHILPLLQGSVDVYVETEGLPYPRVLARGQHTTAGTHIAALMNLFGGMKPMVHTEELPLDDRFTARYVQIEDRTTERKEERVGRWNVSLAREGQRTLVTAAQGLSFIASNDASALEHSIQADGPRMVFPTLPRGRRIAGIKVNRAWLTRTLSNIDSHTVMQLVSPFAPSSSFLASLTQDGQRMTLTLQPE